MNAQEQASLELLRQSIIDLHSKIDSLDKRQEKIDAALTGDLSLGNKGLVKRLEHVEKEVNRIGDIVDKLKWVSGAIATLVGGAISLAMQWLKG